MSRSRKSGKRTDKGRLSRSKLAIAERNPPSAKALARQDRFRHFMGDGSIGHEMTCAGRLMLVGAFDGMELAPEVIQSALHEYDIAYWWNYRNTQPTGSDYQRHSKATGSGANEDRLGERFDAKDTVLRSAGYDARMAVHAVTVDRHWFPDEDAGWAARIINSRILDKRKAMVRAGVSVPPALIVVGELACDSDWAMLDLLRYGALALASGSNQRRRAA